MWGNWELMERLQFGYTEETLSTISDATLTKLKIFRTVKGVNGFVDISCKRVSNAWELAWLHAACHANFHETIDSMRCCLVLMHCTHSFPKHGELHAFSRK